MDPQYACMAIGEHHMFIHIAAVSSGRTLSPPSPIGGKHPQALLHVLSSRCLAHAALVHSEVLTPFSAYAVLSQPDVYGESEA